MDRILIILKKENGPRASSAPALGLNTIIFKMKQISGERLQDHWSSGLQFLQHKFDRINQIILNRTNYVHKFYLMFCFRNLQKGKIKRSTRYTRTRNILPSSRKPTWHARLKASG